MSSAPTIRSFDFAQYRPAYRVDDSGLVELAGSTLGPGASDLLDIIEAVGTADRLAPRPDATEAGQPWTRSLELTIGVRQPHLWRGLSTSLEGLLEWLTDDEWQFDFAPRRSTSKLRDGEITGTLFSRLAGPRPVGLFSGGLDSLCGAVADLTAGQPLSLVSIESNSRMARSQRDLATALGGFGAFNLTGLSVRLHDTDQDESTQRTRGVTFLGLGAAAAYISGSTELRVYENGVGALNLPMSASQVGAHTSKAMHPSTLDRVATLLSEALNWPLSIVNPNMCHTKGEMCAYLPPAVHALVPTALSCDTAYAHRTTQVHSCGRCTSCILRRQSLFAAGLEGLDAKTAHRVDVLSPSAGDALEVMDLYRRYIQEWHRFPVDGLGAFLRPGSSEQTH